MKKIMALVKANLISVISVVVVVISLPALIFLSAGRSSAIHEKVQGDLDGMNRSLQQVQYQYQFEPVTPGEAAIEITEAPTEAMNKAMESWGEQLREQAAESIDVVVSRNAANKRVLVEGLFPEPTEADRVAKLQEIVERWPVAHRALIARVGAGAAPDRVTLEAKLSAVWRQRVERIQSTRDEVGADDLEQIRESLRDLRLAEYRATASDLRFYVNDDAFTDVEPWGQNSLPSMATVWDWQWKHWIHGDLLEALRLANTEGDWERSLLEGPVKRLERVAVSPERYTSKTLPVEISYAEEIAPDWNVSETGRAGWPSAAHGLYDVRYASMSLLIDGDRLLEVVDAISRTNLMRVVKVEIKDVDPTPDLFDGYVYGQGHIVRAVLTIETVWLRSWMKDYMPPEVRQAMGVPGEQDDGSETQANDDSF